MGKKSSPGPFNLTRIIEQRKYNSPKPLSAPQLDSPNPAKRQAAATVTGMICIFPGGSGKPTRLGYGRDTRVADGAPARMTSEAGPGQGGGRRVRVSGDEWPCGGPGPRAQGQSTSLHHPALDSYVGGLQQHVSENCKSRNSPRWQKLLNCSFSGDSCSSAGPYGSPCSAPRSGE